MDFHTMGKQQGKPARFTRCLRTISMATRVQLIAALTLLIIGQQQQVHASGVFELEFFKLQPLDMIGNSNNNEATSSGNKFTNERSHVATQAAQSNEDPSNLVRILVCLKEAFTSQLDGPCTFGNASITLNRDSIQQISSSRSLQDLSASPGRQINQQQQQQQGSLLTNVVRILFTFRWTKSFTIILTAEQVQSDAQDNQQAQASRTRLPAQSVAHRHGAAFNATNLLDASPTNNRTGLGGNKPQLIDRHVLTENEVLPNLEPNQNKPWFSRFSRSLKSSLAYRFRVYCSLNYYGDGCTTFCRPRNDQFGHYNCSNTGQKICLDGWQSPDCDKAQCRSGCNLQHGFCDKPDTCQCRPGWTGDRCDQCITYPGCQNGYCLSPWQCVCQRNWGGVLCDQDLNYCGTHEPCNNNGTCQNVAPGKYKCHCPEGFTGMNCELNVNSTTSSPPPMSIDLQLSAGCSLKSCLNGGTCFGFNYLAGYETGSNVVPPLVTNETDVISDGVEESNVGVGRIYRCQCAPGWTGDYCQWSEHDSLSSTLTLLHNTSSERPPTSIAQINAQTNASTNLEAETTTDTDINQRSEVPWLDKNGAPIFTTIIADSQQTIGPFHMDMKHLISGVVIASILGVFLASLLLSWCCLMAIERNRFSFIQMNIIRDGEGIERGQPIVTSTLRRMHNKIRDSLRRSSRNGIKPETKLSIDNVLRPPKPPPSYDEVSSSCNMNKTSIELQTEHRGQCKIDTSTQLSDQRAVQKSAIASTTNESLVIRGALEQKLRSATSNPFQTNHAISDARLTCPRHGHLYRQ